MGEKNDDTTSARGGRKAVFLDRDGTIIEDMDYLDDPAQIRLLDGAVDGLRRLQKAGYLLLVVTNQSGVARGYFTEERLARIHRVLRETLNKQGVKIDDFYYCPHLPGGEVDAYSGPCECRKPAPGLIERAAAEWNADVSRSVAVGDSERDVEAGRKAGCATVLLDPEGTPADTCADAVAADMAAVADLILDGRLPRRSR